MEYLKFMSTDKIKNAIEKIKDKKNLKNNSGYENENTDNGKNRVSENMGVLQEKANDEVDDVDEDSPLYVYTSKYMENKFDILMTLYNAITNDDVDVDVDLSKFNSTDLGGIYYDLALFSIIANNDRFEDVFSDGVLESISLGVKNSKNDEPKAEFLLEEFTPKEGYEKTGDKSYLKMTYSEKIRIQDGEYTTSCRPSREKRGYVYRTYLRTDVPHLTRGEIKKDGLLMLETFRNIIAHSAQFEINNKTGNLHFLNGNREFVCSKMWLRGFSTLWASRNKSLDHKKIKDIILQEYGEGKKSITTTDDVKNILRLTADETDYRKYSSSMFKFVMARLKYYDNFYTLTDENGKEDLDKKIDIFTNIIENSPNHIAGNAETLNSKIIYNLQQIIAKAQLDQAKISGNQICSSSFNIATAAIKMEEGEKLLEEIKAIEKTIQEMVEKGKKLKGPEQKKYIKTKKPIFNKLSKQRSDMLGQLKAKKDSLGDSLKHEADKMNLFNKNSLKNIPIETAVNVVAAMGYNRLISTGFYQDKLDHITLPQKEFFEFKKKIMNLDMSNFVMTKAVDHGKTEQIPLDSYDKRMLMLRRLRHATSHGLINYSIPQQSTMESSFDDVVMNYCSDGEKELKVSGTIPAFCELFANDIFRPSSSRIVYRTSDGFKTDEQPMVESATSFKNNNFDNPPADDSGRVK